MRSKVYSSEKISIADTDEFLTFTRCRFKCLDVHGISRISKKRLHSDSDSSLSQGRHSKLTIQDFSLSRFDIN